MFLMTGGRVLAAWISRMQIWAERHCVTLGWKPFCEHQWADHSLFSEPSVRCLIHPITLKKKKKVCDSLLKYPQLVLRLPFLKIANQVQERCKLYCCQNWHSQRVIRGAIQGSYSINVGQWWYCPDFRTFESISLAQIFSRDWIS